MIIAGSLLLWVIIRPTSWLISFANLISITSVNKNSETNIDERGEIVITTSLQEKENDKKYIKSFIYADG